MKGNTVNNFDLHNFSCRSQWPRGLRRGCTAARLLTLWFESRRRHACLFLVSVVCCQGDGLITRPEDSYRVWCV